MSSLALAAAGFAPKPASWPCKSVAECTKTPLWHLPGPNPVVAPWNPDGKPAWMSTECEVAGGVQTVNDTFVFTYHCLNSDTNSYRIGTSTAYHPLGPWTKPPLQPDLPAGKKGDWDEDTVASFNAIPDPEAPGQWVGFFEGGMGPGSGGTWSMGIARGPSPSGPWTKSAHNPVLSGSSVHDPAHCFPGSEPCAGLYVASALAPGPHTNHSWWVYMEAPINSNDEGPLALWSAPKPEGPWTFVKYVLDPGNDGGWDAGRFSESRVIYDSAAGLFHLFASGAPRCGSPQGGTATSANKDVEQLGWATSNDGLTFVENAHNPIGAQHRSTPLTSAMAESHALLHGGLVYAYHTIRWTETGTSEFAPDGRNAEDLGVEVFLPSPTFELEFPLITSLWQLDLPPGGASPCSYDWKNYRYCAALRTVLHASGSSAVLKPKISFHVAGRCANAASAASVSATVHLRAFSNDASVGGLLKTLPVQGGCQPAGAGEWQYAGWTHAVTAADLPSTDWVVSSVALGAESAGLTAVAMTALYKGDGTTLHAGADAVA